MANLEPAGSGTATVSKPLALAGAALVAVFALAGAWLLLGAGGRAETDADLIDWIEPLRAQTNAVERDVAETDRQLRIYLGTGKDGKLFEEKRNAIPSDMDVLMTLAKKGDRDVLNAASNFEQAVKKWLNLADDWYKTAEASQDSSRLAVIARMGPEDPLADTMRERQALSDALDSVRDARRQAAREAEEGRPLRLWLGFGLVVVAAGVALWLALFAGGSGRSPKGGMDLGLLRSILDQLPDGVAVFGEDGKLVASNLSAARMLQTSDEGETHLALYAGEGEPVEAESSPLARALGGQHVHERDLLAERLDGSLSPVDVHAEPILDNGRATSAVVIIRDKADELAAEAELQALIERASAAEANASDVARQLTAVESSLDEANATIGELRAAAEEVRHEAESRAERFARIVAGGGTIGVALFDANTMTLIDINEMGLVLLGERRRVRDVRGSALVEVVPGAASSGLLDLFQKVAAGGEAYSSEEYYVQGLRHGTAYWRFSLIPLMPEPDAPADQLLLIGIDTTAEVEQRAMAATAQEAEPQGVWSIEDVLLAISNDLRTPILSIQGMVELFRQKYAEAVPDVTALHYLELTQRNADQIATLIDDLVELSNLGHTELNVTDVPLAAAIEEAWRASPRSGIELRVAGPLPTVRADRALLMRAFRDLFDAAARMRQPGEGSWMHVRVEDDDEKWVITLTDNSSEIQNDAEAERLFGPLARHTTEATNNGGPTLVAGGLGLAAVRRIAELHGGTASASPGGDGMAYRVTIEK